MEELKNFAWNLTEKEIENKKRELAANPNHNCSEHPSAWDGTGWSCPFGKKSRPCAVKYKGPVGPGYPDKCCPDWPHKND